MNWIIKIVGSIVCWVTYFTTDARIYWVDHINCMIQLVGYFKLSVMLYVDVIDVGNNSSWKWSRIDVAVAALTVDTFPRS